MRLGGPRQVWINTVYDELSGRLIEAFKYDCNRQAGRILAWLMGENLALNKKLDYLLVPLPPAAGRRRERGFDHALLLAKLVAGRHRLSFACALGRQKDFRQVGASRAQRIAQAQASYFVRKPNAIAGRNILLVDDVVTTGATLQAAAKALRKAGAKRVDALVFARKI